MVSISYLKKQYKMDHISMHTPSQRVQKLRQLVTHSIHWITANLWRESHVNIPIWCSTCVDMIWGWSNYNISEILEYGTARTKASVAAWGYRARLGKLWATGENW